MSLRELHFVTLLAAVVGFVAIGSLNPAVRVSLQHDPVLAPAALKSAGSPSVLLPVQSKDAKDLRIGNLLVASRHLADPNFAETVILLVRSDAQGAIGLILNRRTDVLLSQVLDSFKAAKGCSDQIYLGGPLGSPTLFALLQSPAKLDGAEHILDSVYLISKKTLFDQILSAPPDPSVFHVYMGYAGWNSDQLRMEVQLGAWFIFHGDAKTIFDSDPRSLWPQMIQKTELEFAGVRL